MKRRTFVLATLAFGATGAAYANDDGLYADVFDPNSSFIRVIAPGQTFATIGAKTLRDLEEGMSPYVNVMPGDIPVSLGSLETSVTAAPGAYYTVVISDGAATVLEDEVTGSPAKSDVTVYNLAGAETVELYVPAAKATAIDAVAPLSGASVALKAPLTLDFELRSGGDTLASVAQVELKRKAGVSIILTQAGDTYRAFAAPNVYTQ
ncbi:MAG: alginate O-acetyltransferase AlgF [Pseudomonadota bacterium]